MVEGNTIAACQLSRGPARTRVWHVLTLVALLINNKLLTQLAVLHGLAVNCGWYHSHTRRVALTGTTSGHRVGSEPQQVSNAARRYLSRLCHRDVLSDLVRGTTAVGGYAERHDAQSVTDWRCAGRESIGRTSPMVPRILGST